MDRPKGIIKNSSRRRQDPVSCSSCRLKKWKCNRQHPCSNCVARDLVCEGISHIANASKHIEPDNVTKAILERLDKLENALSERDGKAAEQRVGTEPIHQTIQREEVSETKLEQIDDLQVPLNISITRYSPPLRIASQPIKDSLIANRAVQSGAPSLPKRTEWVTLPDKEEAIALLCHYAQLANHMHYIVYTPTVRIMLDQVYDRMDNDEPCEHGHVALLLSMFATTSNMWTHENGIACIFSSVVDATQCSTIWAEAGVAVLEHVYNSCSSSLEQVQPSVILGFAMLTEQGLSARSRWLNHAATIAARDLSLHVLDGKKEKVRRAKSAEDEIQLEMKGRLWWHLASSDWAMSLVPGPQEGSSSIHPAHMRVNKPRNVIDDDLAHTSSSFARPLNQPTTVSYLLQRFRLAELSRDIVDAIPLASAGAADASYDTALLLDKKFEQLQNELPTFFKNDETSLEQSRKIYPTVHPCATPDARYQYSRNVVRQCAHTVIQLNVSLEQKDASVGSSNLKLGFAVHHLYWATAVLVMDQCYNHQYRMEDDGIADITMAFRMLERSKDKLWITQNLLHSLTSVLKRHNIHVPRSRDPLSQDHTMPGSSSDPNNLEVLPSYEGNDLSIPTEDLFGQDTFPMIDNDKWWTSSNGEKDLQTLDWDQLFNDLSSTMT